MRITAVWKFKAFLSSGPVWFEADWTVWGILRKSSKRKKWCSKERIWGQSHVNSSVNTGACYFISYLNSLTWYIGCLSFLSLPPETLQKKTKENRAIESEGEKIVDKWADQRFQQISYRWKMNKVGFPDSHRQAQSKLPQKGYFGKVSQHVQ